jgi:hypothetical protein
MNAWLGAVLGVDTGMSYFSKKATVLPMLPVIIYTVVCVALFVLATLDIAWRFLGNISIDILLDPFKFTDSLRDMTYNVVLNPFNKSNSIGFTRRIFVEAWSGVPLFFLALVFYRGHNRLVTWLFLPSLLVSIIPGWWYYFVFSSALYVEQFGEHYFFYISPVNYVVIIISFFVYLYLLVNLLLTKRRDRGRLESTVQTSDF